MFGFAVICLLAVVLSMIVWAIGIYLSYKHFQTQYVAVTVRGTQSPKTEKVSEFYSA